jgi:predicted esterase
MKRVLCLHGYQQNALHFKGRLSALGKKMKKLNIELCFIDAPIELLNDESKIMRAWWTRDEETKKYHGAYESLEYLENFCNQNGPFEGILGFSQGASMASLFLSAFQKTTTFKYAILIGGFIPRDPEIASRYYNETLLDVDSLHLFGEQDEIITADESRKLAKIFDESRSVQVLHPGGHYIPLTSEFIHSHFLPFFKKFD